MGRRKRKTVKVYRKKLPSIFLCPKCGEQSVQIFMDRKNSRALVKCGNRDCELQDEVSIGRAEEAIDAYCKFSDRFYSSR
ncbi:MAG: hypothetical protein QXI32_01695 [Candidatus Bathyarchaeia archaeon]